MDIHNRLHLEEILQKNVDDDDVSLGEISDAFRITKLLILIDSLMIASCSDTKSGRYRPHIMGTVKRS